MVFTFSDHLSIFQNKSEPFDITELEKVLKSLKAGKSKDPNNYICELFKDGVIGKDLKASLLMLMNQMKCQIRIPDALKTANITILHKRNSKVDLNTWRGVFVSSVIRTILMKLIHERTYSKVSSSMTDAQIGARKHKSVRNHLFVLNSIISDVMSTKKKNPIDLNIMDFKQMFDAEELPTVLNSFYEAGVQNDLFAIIYEANKSVMFAVKTPTGLTEYRTIKNKVMQGDVLSPLMSSNMVDKNIGKVAISARNVYMYKNKVEIPPLMMQDDTLAISVCGFRTTKTNTLINTRTNIMGLQFGRDKCVKMHIGKTLNKDICTDCKVDAWKDKLIVQDGQDKLEDEFIGEETMKTVQEKKYLGDIIAEDMKNTTNIRSKTNKAVGIVNKVLTSIKERPYGRHTFRAASIMRQSLLLGSLLNNSESWINITKKDLDDLEKPDTMVHRGILCTEGNPSKVFMHLEFGSIPVRFVIMEKRLNFLKYILNESMESMIRQVFEALKVDSRKGDFVALVKEDIETLNIDLSEEEITLITKLQWKKYVHEKVRTGALKWLVEENMSKSKTKHIIFNELKTSDYLVRNQNTVLSKIIFSVRSGTLDLKIWNDWKYNDTLCVMCQLSEEDFQHFITCEAYGNEPLEINWQEMFGNDVSYQNIIAKEVKSRHNMRKVKLEEDGLPQILAPMLQTSVELQ